MGTESDSPTFTLAAVAPYDDVFKPTTDTEKPTDYSGPRSCSTHESNGAFWYFCPKLHPNAANYPPRSTGGYDSNGWYLYAYEHSGSGIAMGFAPSKYIDLLTALTSNHRWGGGSCAQRHSLSTYRNGYSYDYANWVDVCADKNVSSSAYRLSWHLDNVFGGWRAGFYHGSKTQMVRRLLFVSVSRNLRAVVFPAGVRR